jgi:hypothetical protein
MLNYCGSPHVTVWVNHKTMIDNQTLKIHSGDRHDDVHLESCTFGYSVGRKEVGIGGQPEQLARPNLKSKRVGYGSSSKSSCLAYTKGLGVNPQYHPPQKKPLQSVYHGEKHTAKRKVGLN